MTDLTKLNITKAEEQVENDSWWEKYVNNIFYKIKKNLDQDFLGKRISFIKSYPLDNLIEHGVSRKRRPDFGIEFENNGCKVIIFIELKCSDHSQYFISGYRDFHNLVNVAKSNLHSEEEKVEVYGLFAVHSKNKKEIIDFRYKAQNLGIEIPILEKEDFDYLEQSCEINESYAFLEFLTNYMKSFKYNFENDIEVTAFRYFNFASNPENTFHVFKMSAFDLLRMAIVERATYSNSLEDTQDIKYQRPLEVKRINEISEGILKKSFLFNFPNNIIVNLDEAKTKIHINKPNDDSDIVRVKFPMVFGALQVIDGQHRLFSFFKVLKKMQFGAKLTKDYYFSVLTYFNLTEKDKYLIFSTINGKQKGINANLLYYLEGINDVKNEIGAATRVIISLFRENLTKPTEKIFDSYLNVSANAPQRKKQKKWLSLYPFVRQLTKKVDKEILVGSEDKKEKGLLQITPGDEETPKKILEKYFNFIKKTFEDDWNEGKEGFFQSKIGVQVMLAVLRNFLLECKDKEDFFERPEKIFFNKYIEKRRRKILNTLNKKVDEWKSMSGEIGINVISNEICEICDIQSDGFDD